ncbi:MAG TPA: serine hydrolase domain-containing protein [Anaerolineaceae bacterium]|nr:serine hydrolase domain-containing protein [Anaerolineaceae bacterium]
MTDDFSTVFSIQHKKCPFSGVIAIRRGDDLLFSCAEGLANRSAGLANTLATCFGMASGSKTFTAVAICYLIDQGQLTFDTRLKDCLDVHFRRFDPRVTIHHLLSHTSGIPDYFDEEVEDDYEALWKERPNYTFRTPSDFLPLFQSRPMKFTPGLRWAYSNAGYILLGLIVEKVSSLPFTHFVEENIFKPAGMVDSGYYSLDALPERTAVGYIEEKGGFRSNIYSIPIVGGPDGGAFTTAADLTRFWDALLGARLLSPSTLAKMLASHAQRRPDNPEKGYGYGLWISLKPDRTVRAWTMLGEDPGAAFISTRYLADEVEFTLFGNLVPNAWGMYEALEPLFEEY